MTRIRTGWAAVAAIGVLLAVVHTWPLATAPAALSRNDNGDAQLNEWILAWVGRQAPLAPARLFQANIFYPARDSLAFSEPLIVPALIGAPVAWLGGSPVLVFNLVLLAGFVLTLLGGYAAVYAWTGDRLAGLLAGSTLAFNSHTLSRLPHVQAVHLYALPLALLAADRLVTGPRPRQAFGLTLWLVMLAYTSGYLAVFGALAVAIALAVRIAEWKRYPRACLTALAVAAFATMAAVLPVFLPYARAARQQGMSRTLEVVAEYSATPMGYLVAPGRLHANLWSGPLLDRSLDTFFPGVIVLALGAVAVAGVRRRAGDPGPATPGRIAMLLAIAAAGVLLSFGTATPIYGWVYTTFPPMHALRAAARFGILFLLGLSLLAGLGMALMRRRAAYSRRSTAAACALLAVANLEALRAPIAYRPFEGIPSIYDRLAAEPRRVVLVEVPFYMPEAIFGNAEYVLNSTRHWRPLMNGYSGYVPDSYAQFADQFRSFPDDDAVNAMRRAGVTHVMLHPERLFERANEVASRFAARADVELVGVDPRGLRLYRFR